MGRTSIKKSTNGEDNEEVNGEDNLDVQEECNKENDEGDSERKERTM